MLAVASFLFECGRWPATRPGRQAFLATTQKKRKTKDTAYKST
jgi:hypothetical protein